MIVLRHRIPSSAPSGSLTRVEEWTWFWSAVVLRAGMRLRLGERAKMKMKRNGGWKMTEGSDVPRRK